ncbi:hypothetical protein ACFL1Y_01655 [Patescibacteria group bacterium]
MPNKIKFNNKLIQFKINDKKHDELIKVAKQQGNLSVAELIRDAIKFFLQVINFKKQGYRITAEKEDEKILLHF